MMRYINLHFTYLLTDHCFMFPSIMASFVSIAALVILVFCCASLPILCNKIHNHLQPLCRSTCVSQNPQLRTGGFVEAKFSWLHTAAAATTNKTTLLFNSHFFQMNPFHGDLGNQWKGHFMGQISFLPDNHQH